MAEGTDRPDGLGSARTRRRDRARRLVVVSLAGELDLYNAHAVREALLECCAETPDRLVVDLSEVKFIDSTALGVLDRGAQPHDRQAGFLLAAPGLRRGARSRSPGSTGTSPCTRRVASTEASSVPDAVDDRVGSSSRRSSGATRTRS